MGDYTWQVKAVERHVDDTISAIVAGCGTGKTRTGVKLAVAKFLRRHLPVIVIAPKNLTKQWRDDIHTIAGKDQKVWVYDTDVERKDPEKYAKEFLAWLKDGCDEYKR
jgi:superfamily II DNA or RNA helicase